VSRCEGELLTAPKPRAVSLLSVYLAVKMGNERCRMAQATAPILDSTV
jgi:hypothetical protein